MLEMSNCVAESLNYSKAKKNGLPLRKKHVSRGFWFLKKKKSLIYICNSLSFIINSKDRIDCSGVHIIPLHYMHYCALTCVKLLHSITSSTDASVQAEGSRASWRPETDISKYSSNTGQTAPLSVLFTGQHYRICSPKAHVNSHINCKLFEISILTLFGQFVLVVLFVVVHTILSIYKKRWEITFEVLQIYDEYL